MTTIAYRDGVMAADTRAWSGNSVPIGHKTTKICRLEDGSLLGVSSAQIGVPGLVREWVAAGEVGPPIAPSPFPDGTEFVALIVAPGGSARLLDERGAPSDPMTADYYAIGTGEQYALGAMFAGASAVDAVLAGCYCEPGRSAPPVVALSHDGREWYGGTTK